VVWHAWLEAVFHIPSLCQSRDGLVRQRMRAGLHEQMTEAGEFDGAIRQNLEVFGYGE
jgi:hypothetical protein